MERTFHYLNHPSNQRNSFNNLQRELEAGAEIKKDIEKRDHQDMTREISPLRQAEDAVLVDSSLMNIDEVVAAILGIYKDKVE